MNNLMINVKKFLVLFVLFSSSNLFISANDYVIDKSHSSMIFGIQHMGLGNTYGRFNDFSGTIKFDEKKLESSSINVAIKVASIDTYNKKRDAHLRNADFFDAGIYPEMTFSATDFKLKKDSKDTYIVKGKLTITGTSKEISIELKKLGAAIHFFAKKPAIGFEAHFSISRKDFNFGKGKAAGSVGDKVTIIAAIEAISK